MTPYKIILAAINSILVLWLGAACEPYSDADPKGNFETITLEKHTWGEESFSAASESSLKAAKKTSIAAVNGRVYIGTESNGLWVKEKGQKIFVQVANLGRGKTPGLNDAIGAGNNFSVLNMLSSHDGVLALIQSGTGDWGLSVIKGTAVYATYAFGQNGFRPWGTCNISGAMEIIKTPTGEAIMMGFTNDTGDRGEIIVKDLATDTTAAQAWQPIKTADIGSFANAVAPEQMGDDAWFLLRDYPFYYVVRAANMVGGTRRAEQAKMGPVGLDLAPFDFAGQANQNRKLSVGHHNKLFVGLDVTPGQESKTGGIGVIDANGQASHMGKGGFVANAYVRDGNRITFLTNKGLISHNGTQFEDIIDKAYVNSHQFRLTHYGSKDHNASGFVGNMPSEDFKGGGKTDNVSYLLVNDAGQGAKVYTLTTEKVIVQIKAQ